MILEREIRVENTSCRVVISDKKEALLAAKAAGRVIVGLLWPQGDQDLSPAQYLVESPEAADQAYLERVVRRHAGLPWIIGESKCLLIREFSMEDAAGVPKEPGDTDADAVFYTPALLRPYLDYQYRFYEYGIWAVVRKADGVIVGKAGIQSDRNLEFLELGYHIFEPCRNQGYASEACRLILDYAAKEWGCPLCAVTGEDNPASQALLKKLGFSLAQRTCSGSASAQCLYCFFPANPV